MAGRSAVRDRRVRKLIERARAGRAASLAEHLAVCPYRTLLTPPGVTARPDMRADGVSAVLGFEVADFTAEVRDGIVADLRAGRVMLLIANDAVLHDFAKAEVYRALYQPDEPSLIRAQRELAFESAGGGMSSEQRATGEAWQVLTRLVDAAPFRKPHLPIDMLLQLAERTEREQGRLTEFQVRALAALLLSAKTLAADERDPEYAPRWHWAADAERWHAEYLRATTPLRDVGSMLRSGALARH
jgi:hypothetical protein